MLHQAMTARNIEESELNSVHKLQMKNVYYSVTV